MASLIRSLNIRDKRHHDGPVAGGTFWALASVASFPASAQVAKADAAHLLRHGTLWLQDASKPGSWVQVTSSADLGVFRVGDGSLVDGTVSVAPFLPELYFVPKNWRGARAVQRAQRRAITAA